MTAARGRRPRLRVAGALARLLAGSQLVPGQLVEVSVLGPAAELDVAASALYRVEAIVARRSERGEAVEVVLREAEYASQGRHLLEDAMRTTAGGA